MLNFRIDTNHTAVMRTVVPEVELLETGSQHLRVGDRYTLRFFDVFNDEIGCASGLIYTLTRIGEIRPCYRSSALRFMGGIKVEDGTIRVHTVSTVSRFRVIIPPPET